MKESVGIMVWAQNYVDLTLKDLVFDAHIRFPASSHQLSYLPMLPYPWEIF